MKVGKRDGGPLRAWPMLLSAAMLFLLWNAATYAWYVAADETVSLPEYLYRLQDLPVLAGMAIAFLALIPLDRRKGGAGTPPGWLIALACVLMVILARIGRNLVFHDYSVSRDEVMVELAAAYLADGRIGWPIPAQWLPYARAMMPEFYSPYGADVSWTSIYLPVQAAIRALFLRLGDAELASPVMLGLGLLALWDVARRLFPDRADARAVVMVMALTSTQLLATAMTPYAMTSHFALNMLWLALVLRGGMAANLGAALVLVAAAGLHQWHFPVLFTGPLIIWLLWRGQWASGLVQAGALGAAIILWAELWPDWLHHLLGPPAEGTAGPAPAVGEKVASLFERLEKWQPLFNIGRLAAWNNLLLLPLAAMAVALLPRRLAGWLRDPPVVLPLLGIVLLGFALALYQGYGWGFRYMHGSIGALCLLAGYGWTVLSPDGRRPLRLVWAASLVSLLAAGWLLGTTERHVRGYASAIAAIRAADADVVLVDLRGGFFMTDLVRFSDGRLALPAVMTLGFLDEADLRRLCAEHRVAVIDHPQYWAMGVYPVQPQLAGDERLDVLREELRRLGCDRPVLDDGSLKIGQ